MRKAVRHDGTLGALLQGVISHRRGRGEALIQIAGFENFSRSIGLLGPYAGEAVGLQFNPHRHLIGSDTARAPFGLRSAIGDTQQILYVVPHLVRDDVGTRKISRGAELRGELPIKR